MSQYISNVRKSDFHADTQSFFVGKKVLVTGGSGFIGSHVVEQLIQLNAKPIVMTRQKEIKFLRHLEGQFEVRTADLFDYSQTLKAFDGVEIVLNLAASVAGIEYNKNHPATIFQENLQSFFNSIKAASTCKVERFLVCSSACVYPRHCSIPTPESEGMVGEPEPTNSGYGWAKRMEEYLAQQYFFEHGLSVAIARPYNAFGPRDNFDPKSSHVIPALILKAFNSQDGNLPVWGDGTHSRSFLYVDDFARGLLEVAARYAVAEPVNIGAFEEITIKETAEHISQIVGEIRGAKITPIFQASGITGQPRRKCSTVVAKEQLGYEAKVEFLKGLRTTINWFREEYEKNRTLYFN